jgi:serine/threonine protein kinase
MAASSAFDDNKYMVRYHNVWEEDGYLYLCMELCEHSLHKHIEINGQPNDQYLRKIMRDVCKGL